MFLFSYETVTTFVRSCRPETKKEPINVQKNKQKVSLECVSPAHAHCTGSASETQFAVLHSFVQLYSILYNFVWKFYAKIIELLSP